MLQLVLAFENPVIFVRTVVEHDRSWNSGVKGESTTVHEGAKQAQRLAERDKLAPYWDWCTDGGRSQISLLNMESNFKKKTEVNLVTVLVG